MNYCTKHNERCESADASGHCILAVCNRYFHARWVKTGQSFVYPEKFRNYSCSLCGFDVEKTKYRYCPNCGARMDIDEQRKEK